MEPEVNFELLAKICGGLATETRMRIAQQLRGGSMTIKELVAALEIPVWNITNNLKKMVESGVLTKQENGRSFVFSLDNDKLNMIKTDLLDQLLAETEV